MKKKHPNKLAEATLGEGLTRVAIWEQTADTKELKNGLRILDGYAKAFPNESVFVSAARFHLGMYHLSPVGVVDDASLRSDVEKGRSIMRDAIRSLPETFYTWWMKTEYAASFSREDRFEEAVVELDKLLTQNPDDSWKEYILYIKADAQLRIEKTDEACNTLRQLISLFPHGEWASSGARRLAAIESGR